MNKKRPKPVFTRGMLGTEDVDRLVEMINVDSHDQSASDPKKAAKKARQKQKKEEERRIIEAQEAERLRREELERRLAEEQLERAMQGMKIGGKKKKKGNNKSNNKVDAGQQTDSSISSTQTETIIIGSKKKTFTSRGVSCSLIGDEQVTITAPWKSSYSGWEPVDRVRESPMPPGYAFQPGTPAQAMGYGQMHYPHPNSVERAYNIDALPHSVINAVPLIAREDKLGSVHRVAQGGKIVTTASGVSNSNASVATTNTSSSSKSKKKKNKQMGNNKSSSPIRIVNESAGSSVDIQRANGGMNKWNGMPQNDAPRPAEQVPQKEAGAKPEMVTIRRHPHYSDTTVTISMKNRQGAEDILYTLCNGQVIKPDGEPEDPHFPEVEVSGKKKSKKKRNRKKDKALEPTSQPVEEKIKTQVTMPPVAPVSHFAPNAYSHVGGIATSAPNPAPNISESTAKALPPSPPPVPSHSSNAEIDLSRLKLPPGITITKVEQSQSADGSAPSGNMVRICNTGYFGQSFSITPTVPASPGLGSDPEAALNTAGMGSGPEMEEPSKSNNTNASAVSHSRDCNCNSKEVSSCLVQTNEHTDTPRWQYEAKSCEVSQPNGSVGSSFAHLNEKGIPLLSQPLVNPFNLPSVHHDKQRSLENRKVRLSSLVYGGSVKSSKRKQPRPLNFGSPRDQISETLNETDVVPEGDSTNLPESNSSYQSHALSLQQSLLQSQGRILTSGLSNLAEDGDAPNNFSYSAPGSRNLNLNVLSCSDENS